MRALGFRSTLARYDTMGFLVALANLYAATMTPPSPFANGTLAVFKLYLGRDKAPAFPAELQQLVLARFTDLAPEQNIFPVSLLQHVERRHDGERFFWHG